MKISVDVMGSDLGCHELMKGCLNFLKKEKDIELIIFGRKEEIERYSSYPNLTLVYCDDIVSMDDGALSIRKKTKASMVCAVKSLKELDSSAIVSCGSTGGLLTASLLFLGRLSNVERPALMPVLPSIKKQGVILVDAGANSENTSSQLVSFAYMGSVYAKCLFGANNPIIQLLNIGTEEKKGDLLRKEVFKKLMDSNLYFKGNIESRDIMLTDCDVVITDGFSGNITLKAIEGTAKMIMKLLKQEISNNILNKFGAFLAKDAFVNLKRTLDYRNTGGALLGGVDGIVIKGHGSSDALAMENALRQAKKLVESNYLQLMKEVVEHE